MKTKAQFNFSLFCMNCFQAYNCGRIWRFLISTMLVTLVNSYEESSSVGMFWRPLVGIYCPWQSHVQIIALDMKTPYMKLTNLRILLIIWRPKIIFSTTVNWWGVVGCSIEIVFKLKIKRSFYSQKLNLGLLQHSRVQFLENVIETKIENVQNLCVQVELLV